MHFTHSTKGEEQRILVIPVLNLKAELPLEPFASSLSASSNASEVSVLTQDGWD